MNNDIDHLLQAVADTIRAYKHGGSVDRTTLDQQLQRLASEADLDPKDAAAKVGQLLLERGRLQQTLRKALWPVLIGAGVILGAILAIIFSFWIVSVAWLPGYEVGLSERIQEQIMDALDKTPATLSFNQTEVVLPANEVATATIQVSAKNRFGQLVPGDTQVEFQVTPPNSGTIVPQRSYARDGKAEAIFRAGKTPGDVLLTARIPQVVEQSLKIRLTEIPKPELSLRLDTDPSQKVSPGGSLDFVFSVVNIGKAPATNVVLFAKIPSNTKFVAASDQGQMQVISGVQWQIGNLESDQTIKRTMRLTVQSAGTVTNDEYWVQYDEGKEVRRGKGQLTLEVVKPTVLASIVLSASSPTLLADGKSTVTVTTRLIDPSNNLFTGNVPVSFTIQPADMGSLEPRTITVTNGMASVNFNAGKTTGRVSIIAVSGKISGTTTITLTQSSMTSSRKTTKPTNLVSSPREDPREIIISQLPVGTPVEALGDFNNGFERVVMTVWLPRSALKGGGQAAADTIDKVGMPVQVGESPGDFLNTASGEIKLEAAAAGLTVEVIDNKKEEDPVKVRIRGWILRANLESGQ